MQTLIDNLSKRRRMMFYILIAIAIIGIIIDQSFDIEKTSYFGEAYNMYIVYGLIAYKLIELTILYFIFYHRHMRKLSEQKHISELQEKFEKNAKRFFMLVPHGNVIFGIISYKLTADILYFLLFIIIAISTLLLVKPTRHF
jgi:4-amino-4-deoxy-L-arabinose transferase-like glycosyltransferase